MLNFLKKKRIMLLYLPPDRIGRNLSVFHGIEKMMDAGRVYVVEHGDEPVDSMTLGIMMTMAKQESKNISVRTKGSVQTPVEKHGDQLKWGHPEPAELARKVSGQIKVQ